MRELSTHLLNRTTVQQQEHEAANTNGNGTLRIQYSNSRTTPSPCANIWKFKQTYITAIFSIVCEIILIITLVHNKWFYVNGGGCNRSYLNLNAFLNVHKQVEASIEKSKVSRYTEMVVYKYDDMVNCVNYNILLMMRLLIIFIFALIFLTFLLIIIDIFEDYLKVFEVLRKYFVLQIISIILCLVINGLSFVLTEKLYEQQYITRFKKGKKIDVKFDVGYYLIVILSHIYIIEILIIFMLNNNKSWSSYYTHYSTLTNTDNDLLLNMQRSQPLQLININESPPEYVASTEHGQQQSTLAANTDTEPLLTLR